MVLHESASSQRVESPRSCCWVCVPMKTSWERLGTVKYPFRRFLLLMLVLCPVVLRCQIDESTTLFNGGGSPEAYISFSEDNPTIYMWSGKPVAYLSSSVSGGFNVYGFNGKHLGWYVDGAVRNHEGNPVCGVHRVVREVSLPMPESPKSIKQLLPLKSSKELAPPRPLYRRQWSSTPCGLFLSDGALPESDFEDAHVRK